ncbi:ATP-binding protein [Streptomyces sp. MB09-01]|uniref:ATP-binding protein n=1 Tax=Streptomyces sp. MB09-01 TaxID=3028666 RepID=UPI0029AACBE8|nr:ATP-binding protein [Streptomyces sp. MB09-01]MDX3533108.1 ATP-binding protein [Streptomyces sp. MB09-01]
MTRAQQQTRRLLLRGRAGAVTRCRDFTREALADWQWIPACDRQPGGSRSPVQEQGEDDRSPVQEQREDDERARRRERVEDVLLMVSEVVANACLHAGGPSELVLRHGADGLLIEVTDDSPHRPVLNPPLDPALPGGHGLMVLDRLSRSWGWRPAASGKTVWLEVPPP